MFIPANVGCPNHVNDRPLRVIKECLAILTLAALITGCGNKTDLDDLESEEPQPSATPIIVADREDGVFTVEAKSNPGVTFQNGPDVATFEFEAKGQWSFAVNAGVLGPGGGDAPAGPEYLLPGSRSFALVAARDNGSVEFAGDRYEVRLNPKEVIAFSMNEVPGCFGDNRGSLTVKWAKHR